MAKSYTENAFETAIETYLLTKGGYATGDRDTFDPERGLDSRVLLSFIRETQSKEWQFLKDPQKDKAEKILLDDLCRALEPEHEGCLSVLRHGFKCFGKLFRLAYFAPASGLNPETQRLYIANRLTITRQLRYAFLSQVIPFQDSDLEKLYSYIRFLLMKLPRRNDGPGYSFDDEVSLKYYRLQKISEGAIHLQAGKGGELSGPTEIGTGIVRGEKIELSHLIDLLNERFGTDFKLPDQLFFESIKEDAVADSNLRQAALANTMENFGYVFLKALEGIFIHRMEQNEEITAKYLNEKDFQTIVGQKLLKQVYDQIHAGSRSQQSNAAA